MIWTQDLDVHTNEKGLAEALLMNTHSICFNGELEKIIPELSSNIPPSQLR